jgi:hypothetical protein
VLVSCGKNRVSAGVKQGTVGKGGKWPEKGGGSWEKLLKVVLARGAANEAADDTSGQWPQAAARLSSGTMPPGFTAPHFPASSTTYFEISSSTSFAPFRGELLSQMTKLEASAFDLKPQSVKDTS